MDFRKHEVTALRLKLRDEGSKAIMSMYSLSPAHETPRAGALKIIHLIGRSHLVDERVEGSRTMSRIDDTMDGLGMDLSQGLQTKDPLI